MSFFQQVMGQYQAQQNEPMMAERGPGYDIKSGEWQKGKGMRPEVSTALIGLGQGLGQLAWGQTPNMMPVANAIRAQREGGEGGGGSVGGGGNALSGIMNDPMKRAALMQIYNKNPALAERIMMGALGFDLPQGWATPNAPNPVAQAFDSLMAGGTSPGASNVPMPNIPLNMGQ